jgi:PEP-CTERM motif
MTMKWLVLVLALLVPMSANAVPLETLLEPSASLHSGPLVFSNFSATLSVLGDGVPRNLSAIDVSRIDSGLRISTPGGFIAPPSFVDGDVRGIILEMGFDLTAHRPINSMTVTVSDFFLTGPGSVVSLSAGAAPVGASAVGAQGMTTHEPVIGSGSSTSALTSTMRDLHFDALFYVTAVAPAGFAMAGAGDISFGFARPGPPTRVPEPTPLLLLGAGLIGLAIAQRARWI